MTRDRTTEDTPQDQSHHVPNDLVELYEMMEMRDEVIGQKNLKSLDKKGN